MRKMACLAASLLLTVLFPVLVTAQDSVTFGPGGRVSITRDLGGGALLTTGRGTEITHTFRREPPPAAVEAGKPPAVPGPVLPGTVLLGPRPGPGAAYDQRYGTTPTTEPRGPYRVTPVTEGHWTLQGPGGDFYQSYLLKSRK